MSVLRKSEWSDSDILLDNAKEQDGKMTDCCICKLELSTELNHKLKDSQHSVSV